MPSPRQWAAVAAVAVVLAITVTVLAIAVDRTDNTSSAFGAPVIRETAPAPPIRDMLATAHRLCPGQETRTADLEDATLTIYGDFDGAGTGCVLADLEAPQYVLDHILTTRALDGMQTDQWGEFQARWTYHPDEGLNLTIWRP